MTGKHPWVQTTPLAPFRSCHKTRYAYFAGRERQVTRPAGQSMMPLRHLTHRSSFGFYGVKHTDVNSVVSRRGQAGRQIAEC